jgi:hypothetical protein
MAVTARPKSALKCGVLALSVGENRLVTSERRGGQRYLVRHDYGMGALWWWIRAGSAAEITSAFAEVEVITDPATIRTVESWSLEELDIAEAVSGPLAAFYQQREQQRHDPGFGALLGKECVYLRLPDPEEPAAWWLTEHNSAGRRVRQIELRPDGAAVASSAADWPMNPPFDLGDPSSPRTRSPRRSSNGPGNARHRTRSRALCPCRDEVIAGAQLQFALQFTYVQHRPWRFTQDGDMHGWTPVDVRIRRAADS